MEQNQCSARILIDEVAKVGSYWGEGEMLSGISDWCNDSPARSQIRRSKSCLHYEFSCLVNLAGNVLESWQAEREKGYVCLMYLKECTRS